MFYKENSWSSTDLNYVMENICISPQHLMQPSRWFADLRRTFAVGGIWCKSQVVQGKKGWTRHIWDGSWETCRVQRLLLLLDHHLGFHQWPCRLGDNVNPWVELVYFEWTHIYIVSSKTANQRLLLWLDHHLGFHPWPCSLGDNVNPWVDLVYFEWTHSICITISVDCGCPE